METDKYQYSPLSGPRQIRLLKLHPRDDSEDSQLSVDLITVPLDEAPPFEALSYAWGDPLPQAEIRCSGLTAKIGLSLHGALRQLAPRAPEPDRVIWADALCINQEDIPERNAQVRIMGEIYSKAFRTLIWLGEEDEHVARAMDHLKRFLDVVLTSEPPEGSEGPWTDVYASSHGKDRVVMALKVLHNGIGPRESRAKEFGDIWELLRRPWFSRKWVIQELAVSFDHDPVLIAGSKSVTFKAVECFFFVVWVCKEVLEEFRRGCPWSSETKTSLTLVLLNRARTLALCLDRDEPLLLLLARTLQFLCTDPRDHLFAILGMSKKSSAYKHLIDYDTPIAVVSQPYRALYPPKRGMERMAQASLNDAQDLHALWAFGSVLTADLRQSVYPVSWVPNLEKLPTMHPEASGQPLVSNVFSQMSKACGSTRLDASVKGEQLQIKGRIVDRLEELSKDESGWRELRVVDYSSLPAAMFTEAKNIDSWMDDCQAISEAAGKDEESFLEALFNCEVEDTARPEWSYRPFKPGMKAFPEWRRVHKAASSAEDETRAMEIMDAIDPYVRVSWSGVSEPLMSMVYRRFARTMHGRLGWAPRAAKEGDLICVFDGMTLPYTVRPKREAEGVYELVGECFITGLMAGQAMDMVGVESVRIMLE